MIRKEHYDLKLERLRKTLEPGIKQAKAGIFAEYSLKDIISELNQEPAKHKS